MLFLNVIQVVCRADFCLFDVMSNGTIVAALGGLLFGFDTAVIAGITDALTKTYSLSTGGLGLTVSSALWGTIIGAMLAGIPGEKFGRREIGRAHV